MFFTTFSQPLNWFFLFFPAARGEERLNSGKSVAGSAESLAGMETSLDKLAVSLAALTASLAKSAALIARVGTSLQAFLQPTLRTTLTTPPSRLQ
jgi:hypothetical protein